MELKSLPTYQRNLEYFIKAVRSDNTKLIIGNQPNRYSTMDDERERYENGLVCYDGKTRIHHDSVIKGMEKFNETTKQIAKENNIPFIDLESFLPRTSEYFLDWYHWTEKGHVVIANKLYKFIVDGKYIPE